MIIINLTLVQKWVMKRKKKKKKKKKNQIYKFNIHPTLHLKKKKRPRWQQQNVQNQIAQL